MFLPPPEVVKKLPGIRKYVDPQNYASPDAALKDFAHEIPSHQLRLDEVIGGGKNFCDAIDVHDVMTHKAKIIIIKPIPIFWLNKVYFNRNSTNFMYNFNCKNKLMCLLTIVISSGCDYGIYFKLCTTAKPWMALHMYTGHAVISNPVCVMAFMLVSFCR